MYWIEQSGKIEYATYWESKRTNPINGALTTNRQIRYPGAGGTPDSAKVWQITSSSQQLRTFRYQYNSYGNPERISIFNEGNTTITPNQTYTFYYELYDNGLLINSKHSDLDFKVYPNPFDNYLSIDLKLQQAGGYSLRLLNITGHEVYSQMSRLQSGTIKVKLPELSKGIYLLEIQTPNGDFIRKKLVRGQ